MTKQSLAHGSLLYFLPSENCPCLLTFFILPMCLQETHINSLIHFHNPSLHKQLKETPFYTDIDFHIPEHRLTQLPRKEEQLAYSSHISSSWNSVRFSLKYGFFFFFASKMIDFEKSEILKLDKTQSHQ